MFYLIAYWNDVLDYSHTSHNSQKMETIKNLSTDEWINKWYRHTKEIYSAIKMNEILIRATT